MKYYSEKLNKLFDDAEQLKKAELALVEKEAKENELRKVRKERAQEVADAYKKVEDAYKEYQKILDEFIKDYGSYHMSVKNTDLPSIFDILWRWPF